MLLIAKLNAHGFRRKALKIINKFQGNQRTKTNKSLSSWDQTFFGAPQDSVLRPILFNTSLSDLFLILNDIDFASYADRNTLYKVCDNVAAGTETLNMSAEKLFKWFKDN